MRTELISMAGEAPVFSRIARVPSGPKETQTTRVHSEYLEERETGVDRVVGKRPVLYFVTGPQQGMVFVLGAEQTVGREGGADIVVHDESVSRTHSRLVRHHDAYFVEDLESRNGTFVGGERVVGSRRLRLGDYVRFGSVTLAKLRNVDDIELNALVSVHESTLRDPLTRLYNRRYFDERLRNEFSFAQRHRSPLALMLLDIDHFKRINDEHSHLAGDFVLRLVAANLQRLTRPEDVVARYGGEEFVVLGRDMSLRNAEILAERIRQSIAHMKPNWASSGRILSITVSAGVTGMEDGRSHDSSEAMLQVADIALYDAKARGRNRISTFASPRSNRASVPAVSETRNAEVANEVSADRSASRSS